MKTTDFLRKHKACEEGAKWALSVSNDMAVVWDALIEQGNHSWLLWTATRPGVFPDAALRKMACRFVRETPLMDGRAVWDLLTDERSRKAIEVAETYADGKATDEELNSARSAAYDAYCAAAYDAYDADDVALVAAAAAYASYCAAYDAYCAASAAYDAAACAACAAANAAYVAVYAAQIKTIAAMGNPFKRGIQQ